MHTSTSTQIRVAIDSATEGKYIVLQAKLLRASLFNFVLLALIGVLLRSFPVFQLSLLSYKNVLHAHSHFAFGGWITPVLFYLVMRYFPELRTGNAYRHWRNAIVLLLISAYGMLFSFPFQGYGAVSIVFSTLSIVAGSYAALASWSIIKKPATIGQWFLIAAFVYFFLSAIGPFATGPLIVMGKAGTPIYFNAIYFYLHFQYNGFFGFILFAVLYQGMKTGTMHHGKKVFWLLNIACVPAYFLSVLWTKPAPIFYFLGGAAAVIQLVALALFLCDLRMIEWRKEISAWLFRISIASLVVKCLLQAASAFPTIANLAYLNRNFIIAYLHLVLIGFISLFVFGLMVKMSRSRVMNAGVAIFLLAFATTELLLVLQNQFIFLPGKTYLQFLLGASTLFPVGLMGMLVGVSGRWAKNEIGRFAQSGSKRDA